AAGLEPTTLSAKEGLSLINGTQFMAAFGALGWVRAQRLAKTADLACALSLEALQGSRTSFLPQIHRLRPLQGQIASAANILRLLDGSAIIEAHKWCDKVQDAYSLRCAPQVHGAARDLLDYVEGTIAVELNAATDNPLVLVEDELLVSNGNFHGQPLAFALDALSTARRSSRPTSGATRCRTRTPFAAHPRYTAPRAISLTTSRGRSQSSSTRRPTIRSSSSRTSSSSPMGTFTDSRSRLRSMRSRWRLRSSRTSPSGASSDWSTPICRTACRHS